MLRRAHNSALALYAALALVVSALRGGLLLAARAASAPASLYADSVRRDGGWEGATRAA